MTYRFDRFAERIVNDEARLERDEREEIERRRLEMLSTWEKIMNLDAPYALKEVLWELLSRDAE